MQTPTKETDKYRYCVHQKENTYLC
jgi:hypothetical protein